MKITIDCHLRLDPHPRQENFAAGFAARIHDPLWFLTRQWQMGEFQGENAATPVRVDYSLVTTPIKPSTLAPEADPTRVPAESIIEDEDDSWWTMGRRLRIGSALAAAGAPIGAAERFTPPPPYEKLADRPDGLAIWRHRVALELPEAAFTALGVPVSRRSSWQSDELVYSTEFPTGDGPHSATLTVPRHRGGEVDWITADASSTTFSGDAEKRHVFPAPLHYPGAPASRWWEFEDAAVDIGGYPPDSAHPVTALLIELICTHGDNWFVFPIDVPVGHVATLQDGTITVIDSFGESRDVGAPQDWFLFKTSGASASSLVMWLRAVTPLEGPVLEDVLFGVDEYSNRLWAVERRVGGHDVPASDPDTAAGAPPGLTIDPGARRYRYLAGTTPNPHWHPYEVEDVSDGDSTRRRFVQHRIADLSGDEPRPIDPPVAEVLLVHTPGGEVVHEIEPATIPTIGVHVMRRYKLARGTDGAPCLWLERDRSPVLRPPSQTVRFDDVVEIGE